MDDLAAARERIPCPPGYPIIGNILDLQDEVPMDAFSRLASIYGPIFKLRLPGGREPLFASGAEVVAELCDETRFHKKTTEALNALDREGVKEHSGLFSAESEEDIDWQLAHRILLPAFGPLSIQAMFDEMLDIASQLVLKWARMGDAYRIPVTSDFTRLTLDTIALCAMDFRFNSFYQDELHPYVKAMTGTLGAASSRNQIAGMLKRMLPWDRSVSKLEEDQDYMKAVAQELVTYRREHPTDKHDLLNAMVNGKDPKTGQGMPDGLIGANMSTFLIAGHETTSGMLSFAFVHMLQNPAVYFKAQQEVDSVVGRSKITVKHLNDLKYIEAILRETLRIHPTAPAFARGSRPECKDEYVPILGGKYAFKSDERVVCILTESQSDPTVFGEDAKVFNPERMMDGKFEKLPPGVWKPFGTGIRACIGRAFAWQEALLVMALLLQNFNFKMDDPNYRLKLQQILTIKPKDFYMRATLRDGVTATALQQTLNSSDDVRTVLDAQGKNMNSVNGHIGKPVTILYGSNTGTCQSLAQKLSVEAGRHGYKAQVLDMDSAVGKVPKNQPIVIITASYEGQPPDNAIQFVAWLESLKREGELGGVQYAVFGCGHRDWADTFQRIPKLVDELIGKHGGTKIADSGSSDASKGDIFSEFDAWLDTFWNSLGSTASGGSGFSALEVEIGSQNRSSHLRQDVKAGKVTGAYRLTAQGEPEKRHLEVQLPDGMTYVTGDYLAILPLNPQQNVDRVMRHFRLAYDSTLTVKAGAATFLPTGQSLSTLDLLKGFVELSQPATKKDLQACVTACKSEHKQAQLRSLVQKDSFGEVLEQRTSLIDVLERYDGIDLSFAEFLSMLPPLRPRHYSISSSPLSDPTKCAVTYAVINEVAFSGTNKFIGVTSNYLANLREGDEIQVSVRATNKFFHLPTAVADTPIVMFCAGSGIAPFRGFLQERAVQILDGGKRLAPALMFVGCRSSTEDRLYADEIDRWAKTGVVDVRYAFSREQHNSEGCRYIQDRMLKDKKDILALWDANAKVFVCGGHAASEAVAAAAKEILKQRAEERGIEQTAEKADEYYRKMRNERIVVDTFA